MRSEKEILKKKQEIEESLAMLELEVKHLAWWRNSKKKEIMIEFHKNNLCFIYWTLGLKWYEK